MKIYYYHTQDIQRIWREWHEGKFPGHFLYGATHFEENGIEMILHKHLPGMQHWKITAYTTWRILSCREHYDVLYGTSFRGLELIIFLRALRLYRHKIVIWHHQPIVKAKSRLRECFARLFYRGIDEMFFFSERLIEMSLLSSKARRERMHLGHWGPDLEYYDQLLSAAGTVERKGFISSGKEMRDMPTLIQAFNNTGMPIDIYINHSNGDKNYTDIIGRQEVKENVKVHFLTGLIPHEICQLVNRSTCVCICCLETNYTVGLTTVVEAMALGLPMICSRNPQMPIDIEREGIGLTVDYGDVKGWEEAIRYMSTHPEEARAMGERGRKLAEERFNIKQCTREIATLLKSVVHEDSASGDSQHPSNNKH